MLNPAEYADASVLIGESNFGCGCIREHAVWGLQQFGIRAAIAPMKKLFDTTAQALQRPDVKAVLAHEGTEVALSRSPEDFAAFLTDDNRFWAKLVKDAGVKLD